MLTQDPTIPIVDKHINYFPAVWDAAKETLPLPADRTPVLQRPIAFVSFLFLKLRYTSPISEASHVTGREGRYGAVWLQEHDPPGGWKGATDELSSNRPCGWIRGGLRETPPQMSP